MKESTDRGNIKSPIPEPIQEVRELGLIKSEVNFARLPFFALSRRGLKEKGEVEYRDTIERDGEKLDILWRVTANIRYGYPGPFDKKVHKAVEFLISKRGFPVENPLTFSFYELCKLMSITNSGRTKRRIRDALVRTKLAGIESRGAFYYKGEKRWIDDIFNLYDRVVFVGEKFPNGEVADRNHIFLSDWYLKSLNSFYVKPLDFDYYRSLRGTLSGRLYEFLSIQFYGLHGKPYSAEYHKLCQLLPIVEQKYFSKAKEILNPAHQELRQTEFLTQVRWREIQKGRWVITYYPGERAKEEFNKFRLEEQLELELPVSREGQEAIPSNEAERLRLIKELEVRGITSSTAVELVERYPERISEKLEVSKWLIEKKSPLVEKNPAGFLRRSIEENYQLPEEYRSHREREAKKLEEERMMAQKRAQERAEEEKRERELARIETYKENLNHEERAKLREKAEAEIRNSGQFKEEFITDYLIEAKENDIIREQIGIKPSE